LLQDSTKALLLQLGFFVKNFLSETAALFELTSVYSGNGVADTGKANYCSQQLCPRRPRLSYARFPRKYLFQHPKLQIRESENQEIIQKDEKARVAGGRPAAPCGDTLL
jgi:hypothetical protein